MDAPKELALRDIKKHFLKPTQILEVGFGKGEFLESLLCSGYINLSATEVSYKCIKDFESKHKDEVELLFSNNPHFTEANSRVEVTCCFEVIEHLNDPATFLKTIPGKILYLSTPNPNRWLPVLTLKYLGRAIFERWDYPPNHLHRFTVSDLSSLLHNAGYSSLEIHSTKVDYHTLLRSIVPGGPNSENYDDMRPKYPWITSNIRRAATPITYVAAKALTTLKYFGISYYVKAVRE